MSGHAVIGKPSMFGVVTHVAHVVFRTEFCLLIKCNNLKSSLK